MPTDNERPRTGNVALAGLRLWLVAGAGLAVATVATVAFLSVKGAAVTWSSLRTGSWTCHDIASHRAEASPNSWSTAVAGLSSPRRSKTSCVGIGPTAGHQARCVIAYSLFVPHSRLLPSLDRYLTGLQARQFEAVRHFPGWETRLYLDGRFSKAMAEVIRKLGYTVIHLPPSDTSLPEWHHMASRMLVIDDPEVDVFMMRDLDSALSPRDAISVWTWLSTGLPFLSMHDHHVHVDLMMGGMWGGRTEAALAYFAPNGIRELLDTSAALPEGFATDQVLLAKLVWPLIECVTLQLDLAQAVCKHDGALCNPFPMEPHTGQKFEGFIGEVYGSLALVPKATGVDCTSLAQGLDQTSIFDEEDLQKQWLEDAWPRMRDFCKA